ncbi:MULTISPECIES: helix-turn-helix domain-containing protein [Bacillus cereus group]|uniref:helix-turn-helix domain-containing protein n=1 Tax=Bacillus cereus group TaxID=86661 RepID=UPI0008FE89DF|nr:MULTISPECIES: helix-turn-helix domain-containing protein [Bacillus cereus group]MDG1621972.1 helix-turn-helix transcriptional regulator [Bacillus mobilis]MDX5839642.1 helix-turn-helix transcriptional regulator [Bacillus cereus group sp. BfR-BA-01700]MED4384533.1 helix-turn-helix transcriptional regulator [Bacillus mobilis]OJE47566.1 transcriptional regulator [Bacillus mobilis]HDR7241581.1 helix-turn-helix transcriptional regulator [Bacillus mobilis]
MAILGENIKALRKQKNLTQTELAGTELTKSMLSQIENGKATPSMKTLKYLASKLQCETSFLLKEDSEEVAELLPKMEQAIKYKKFEEVYYTLLPIIQKELPPTLSTARLYKQFIRAALDIKDYKVHFYIEKAGEIFRKYALYRESTQISVMLCNVLFTRKKYEECLELLVSIRKDYEIKQLEMELIIQVELFLCEAIILLAHGNYKDCEKISLQALEFSKKHQVYYKTGELYQILSYQKVLEADKSGYLRYINKWEQFAIFTEDTIALANIDILKAYYYNSIMNEYTLALEYVKQFRQKLQNEPTFIENGLYYIEKGKALYGLKQYKEALEALKQATIPDYMLHPLDQAWVITGGAYRALCYMEFKDKQSALQVATETFHMIQEFPDSVFTAFIKETLKMVQKL